MEAGKITKTEWMLLGLTGLFLCVLLGMFAHDRRTVLPVETERQVPQEAVLPDLSPLDLNTATAEEKNLILSLTNRNSFNVRYLDTEDDTIKYGLFYRGNDLRIEPLLRYDGTGFPRYAISFTMVEF